MRHPCQPANSGVCRSWLIATHKRYDSGSAVAIKNDIDDREERVTRPAARCVIRYASAIRRNPHTPRALPHLPTRRRATARDRKRKQFSAKPDQAGMDRCSRCSCKKAVHSSCSRTSKGMRRKNCESMELKRQTRVVLPECGRLPSAARRRSTPLPPQSSPPFLFLHLLSVCAASESRTSAAMANERRRAA